MQQQECDTVQLIIPNISVYSTYCLWPRGFMRMLNTRLRAVFYTVTQIDSTNKFSPVVSLFVIHRQNTKRSEQLRCKNTSFYK